MENFKNIIAEERRRAGMTQEAFATKLGITPQAVSKWENGVGYPDVTLFPTIAAVLGIPIQRLFGEGVAETEERILPETENGLKLVFSDGHRVCYSNKEVADINEESCKCTFCDGSEADLPRGTVINRGRGEIRIYEVEDVAPQYPRKPQPTETAFSQEVPHFEELDLKLSLNCVTKVKYDPDLAGRCRVCAEGDPEFIDALNVDTQGDVLTVSFKSLKNYNGRGEKNKLNIFTDTKGGKRLKASISGSGTCEIPYRFDETELSIAGSGDIKADDCKNADIRIAGSGVVCMKSADENVKVSIAGSGDVSLDSVGQKLNVSIAGSGDVTVQNVAHAECGISGSGDIVIKNITETLGVRIQGSGDIICGGHVRNLKLNISGGGDFKGQNLTAETAHLTASGSAEITIGAITGTSTENLNKSCTLRVGSRGAQV